MLDKETLTWLAHNIDPDKNSNEEEIKDMLRNQTAVSYLLIWPILEQRQFDGFMNEDSIKRASEKLASYYNSELLDDLDDTIEYFFNRYNISKGLNNKFLKALQPKGVVPEDIKRILKYKYYSALNPVPQKKIQLLLFVIYRYRNNIFHGNKSIEKWIDYKDQINKCLYGMMKIADCMKSHNIFIPKPPKNYNH